MSGREELLNCPFCGCTHHSPIENVVHVVSNDDEGRYAVQCDGCTATMGYSETEEEAITAWNTRHQPADGGDGELRDRLDDSLKLMQWFVDRCERGEVKSVCTRLVYETHLAQQARLDAAIAAQAGEGK